MEYLPASMRDDEEFAALLSWWEAPMSATSTEAYLPVYWAMLDVRAAFTKAYEEAAGSGAIAEKTTQAASAKVTLDEDQYGLLTGSRACDLAEPLVCSAVEVLEGDELSVEVVPATGEKCERCWNYRSLGPDHLCCRCHAVVEAL
jgi:isoleucyl-tRNA synthetase